MKRIVFVLTVMLSVLCLSACNFNGSSKPKKGKKVELRICSYNIWAHYAREGQIAKNNAHPSRSWDKSKEDLVDLIVKMDCDIIGMQEVSAVCRDDINDLLQKAGADYELWWKNKQTRLFDMLSLCNVDSVSIRTDQDYVVSLMKLFAQRT